MDKKTLVKIIRSAKPDVLERHSCFICDKWKSITHCHHIIEVSKLADYCLEKQFFGNLPMQFVWLCPNHHEWLHRSRDKNNFFESGLAYQDALFNELSDEERAMYRKLENIEYDLWIEIDKLRYLGQAASND